MFHKAEAFARRVAIGAKHHITHAYHQGRQFASKVNSGYEVFKRLHGALAPALKDVAPQVARHTKAAMQGYERTRAEVMGAHSSAEKVVHAVEICARARFVEGDEGDEM